MTSTFKTGTGSCGDSGGHGDNGGWDPPRFGEACGGLCGLYGVFPNIQVLYSNDLRSEALSSTSSISST